MEILEAFKKGIHRFQIKPIEHSNRNDYFALRYSNQFYNNIVYGSSITLDEAMSDLTALPPMLHRNQKYFYGFYKHEELVCILDFILGYPEEDIMYIGLFMIHQRYQGDGIGSYLIEAIQTIVVKNNIKRIRLGVIEGNYPAYSFWAKHGFCEVGCKKISITGRNKVVTILEKCI